MGLLTGDEILKNVERGDIVIDPFDKKRLNPNSYNLRLDRKLITYNEKVLDLKIPNDYTYEMIPKEGIVLQPGKLYLGCTIERTGTDKFIPMIEGRSSLGRLGVFVHVTAGFGDIGFCGHWTLEICVIHPVRIYDSIEVAQIYYHTPEGNVTKLYKSRKYQNNYGVQPSLSWFDFEKDFV